MPSFDVVSEIDKHELTNAVDQANRELANRFDFRGTEPPAPSIITEYVQAQGQSLSTTGLGASVAMAADQRDIPMLAASALLMAFLVVVFNRLVWSPLYRLAETRYALNR